MAQGRKLDDETKEKIIAHHVTGKSARQIAGILEISDSSVGKYIKSLPDDHLSQLRAQKREQFINVAWQDIEAALELGRQKINLATVTFGNFQETIDKLIELLEDNDSTNGKDIIELIKAISSVTSIPLSHISTYFGTLYDKQALAVGDPTSREELVVVVKLPDELE